MFPFPNHMLLAPSGVVYDTDAAAYFAAMSVQPDATRKGLINDLFVGLKADGVYSKLDVLHLIASHDSQAAKLNAINPATATITLSGTPTFTTDRGYTTDGSTNLLDTNRAANAAGNYAQNSMSFGVYVNGTSTASGSSLAGWFTNALGGTTVNPNTATPGNSSYRSNTVNVTGVTGGPTNSLGLSANNRSSSLIIQTFRNGTQVGSNGSVASITPDSSTFKYGGITGTTATRAGRFAVGFVGGSLSSTEHANLYSRLLTFLTAIGAN